MNQHDDKIDLNQLYLDMEERNNDGYLATLREFVKKKKTLTKGEVLRRLREKFKDKSGD